jgi:phospholipid/cholesterol/gamma-HCH transport system substrate-binding protein
MSAPRRLTAGRIAAVGAVVIALVVLGVLVFGGSSGYTVTAYFQDASQLVKGDLVEVAGQSVGTVSSLSLSPNGRAAVKLSITNPDYEPLRVGTVATVRQASLSGVANRYVDLRLPPGEPPPLSDGVLPTADTNSAVDLDQLFDTFDPQTRQSLSRVIQDFGGVYAGRSAQLSAGYEYLDPVLATSSRLFSELNADTPLFERFVVSTAKLVTDVAQREADLSGIVAHVNGVTGAIAGQRAALASGLSQLPPFMRRANTTFVNLRATLDALTPLVDESKPLAQRLRPFLGELRPLAQEARPTLRSLSTLISSRGPSNDLLDLLASTPAVRNIAIGPVQADGAARPGAFGASTQALTTATPELAFARPYAPDLEGWFDDFSHSGMTDANGAASRAEPLVDAFANINGALAPIPPALRAQVFASLASLNQRNRCPGAGDHGTVFRPSPDFNCDPSQTLPGS